MLNQTKQYKDVHEAMWWGVKEWTIKYSDINPNETKRKTILDLLPLTTLPPSTSPITVNFPSSPPQINSRVGGGEASVCLYMSAGI